MGERKDCAMNQDKFYQLKEFIKKKIVTRSEAETKGLLAEIFYIFQEYCISEEQEMELYHLVDPEDKYNSVADYWYEVQYSDVEVWQFVEWNLLGG